MNFNEWNYVSTRDLSEVVKFIVGGTVQSINADDWLLDYITTISQPTSVLDFGCGIGRNIFSFSDKKPDWKFYGYDNNNMIEKAEEFLLSKFNKNLNYYKNINLTSNWDYLRSNRFDCIYATLVFQHIREVDLNQYLQDIKKMTNRLIVSGRRFNDDTIDGKYKNTWQILENNGYYPSNYKDINYKIDGDPEEHTTCIYDIRSHEI
jgi:SAM-dependent methyltransferase